MRIPAFVIGVAFSAWSIAAGPNSDVRRDFPRGHEQRAGAMALFAATIVEGGGVRGNNAKPPPVATIDVSEEFAGQHVPPGRVQAGLQPAVFRIIAASQMEAERDFETPMNGTRFIAFGDPRESPLTVYANHVFADTPENRAVVAAGRPAPSQTPSPLQLALFGAAIVVAFAAWFLPWFRPAYGWIALAVSVLLWLGYETTIPTQVNIRVDLVILFPFMLVALVSTLIATFSGGRPPRGAS